HRRQIAEPAVLADCLYQAGAEHACLEAAAGDAVKRKLRRTTEMAADMGIFGAPSFVVGDELFWGDDRLDAALECAVAQVGGL
ncbi:MAG: DsbA family protein, partial [Paracoccaceae bacterium]